MAEQENILRKDMCSCGSRDAGKLRLYTNDDNKLIGTFCMECTGESLIPKYITDTEDDSDILDHTGKSDTRLFLRKPPILKENTAFQVQCTKTKISLKHFADVLKPGDHITWHRPYVIWHHSIVQGINAEGKTLDLIHWTKDDKEQRIKIISEKVPVGNETMHRIDYPDDVTKANDTELVLARARSRIGDTGYGFFSDNCESFATYCKTGVAKSHQFAWMKGKVKELVGDTIAVAMRAGTKVTESSAAKHVVPIVSNEFPVLTGHIVTAEGIERAVNGSNWVGAGIVVAMEAGYVIWDLGRAYSERTNGNVTRTDFIEVLIKRAVEGLVGSGLTIFGSLAPELICTALGSPLGPAGILVFGIIGGVVGGVIGKAGGAVLGSKIGHFVASFFMDDRLVNNINHLEPGDHIVLSGWLLHPRCHAIVVNQDSGDNILVIHNTYSNGVVEEWVPFRKPLFRIEYKQDKCYPPETVLENARSRLGENKYNLLLYNCKTFARQCKSEFLDDTDNEPWELVNFEHLPKEMRQNTCGPCTDQ